MNNPMHRRAGGGSGSSIFQYVVFGALALGAAGCASRPDVSIIDPLASLRGTSSMTWDSVLATRLNRESESQAQRREAYASESDPIARLRLRNEVAFVAMAWIEEHHQRSRIRLAGARAAHDAAADLAVIGLTTAASLGSGEALKSALAATAAAITGANLAINDRFLRDQATSAILAQMDADHRAAMRSVRQRLSERDDATYPLAAVDLDLLECLYAGTVTSAVASLADDAAMRRARMRESEATP